MTMMIVVVVVGGGGDGGVEVDVDLEVARRPAQNANDNERVQLPGNAGKRFGILP
jgi:hypothetical protein